ncbi:hypothetical protein [Carnobacterium pleistocenium]|uniref:hypothetical protein n=1 Tax=Carnobacterium pleistocenium TaxID=181073 RepID=UPI00054E11E6|nr:hypothetical protein [Carnobacterium pleistocenium]
MKKFKLNRLREGFLYGLLFMGFNGIKNLIFDYGETSQLIKELSHSPKEVIGVVAITLLGLWLVVGLLIGVGLIISDVLKK